MGTSNLTDLMPVMVEVTKDIMVKARGVKAITIDKIQLEEFFTTCLATGKLGIRDTQLGDHRLTDYKLDSRMSCLVAPRGVYIDEKLHALNLMQPFEIDDSKVLGPDDFMIVQSDIIGALRSSDQLNTDLLQASESLTLSLATERLMKNDMVHDSGSYFLPVMLSLDLYRDSYYNLEAKFCLREFIRQWAVGLK